MSIAPREGDPVDGDETSRMSQVDEPHWRGLSIRELMLEMMLELLHTVPFKAALITLTPITGTPPLYLNLGYTQDMVTGILNDLTPKSPVMQNIIARPDRFYDWTNTTFPTSPLATRLLIPAGLRQGTSFALGTGTDRTIGTFHLNMTDEEFSSLGIDLLFSVREALTGLANKDRVRRYAHLSRRELEILDYLVLGWTNAEIAERLSVARRTVATHIENILRKLRVDNRVQAAIIAREIRMQP